GMMIARDASRYNAVVGTIAVPAALALFLSIVGIYGVTAFAAAQRTHEIGVRMALGATRRDIVALFLRSLRWPLTIGIAGGSVCAMISIAILKSTNVVMNPSAIDPSAYGAAIGVLLVTATVATLVPAVRAARDQPWVALRNQ